MSRYQLISWIVAALVVYLGAAAAARLFSERIIFQPPPATYRDTSDIIKIATPDGGRLSAVHLTSPNNRYTILYSHGNGEDLGVTRIELERLRRLGFDVFAYDYSGYGTSTGAPSEAQAYEDSRAAYTYLTAQLGVQPENVIAYGRSLGGALAIDLAAREPLAGLIVESSFTSAYTVMTRVPLFPGDRFANLGKLARVRCPVLVMHGTNDRVIPLRHGERLYAAAPDPKRPLWIDGADHNNLADVAGARYGHALHEFRALIESTRTPATKSN